ncbi:MAG: hypothetical protein ABSH22_05950 [Tepidisphaeraceae bacterium]
MAKFRSRLTGIAIAAAVAACPLFAYSQATAPTSQAAESEPVGPLRIQVTAVQGGTQYRLNADSKWQTLTAGVELPEGVEFRTGPKGTIQFTVGTDQVYRIDRLTAAKILRAALLPDGTIKTDLGMSYGRVSKDVDLATHPHEDRIISPSSTLAVRGTRVALYDQPPYTPEAISLTGAAVFQNLHGQLVQLGSKGSGPATVSGDSTGAAETQLQTATVDSQGAFAGRSPAEQANELTVGGLANTPVAFIATTNAQIAGETQQQKLASVTGVTEAAGEIQFGIFWTSSTPLTIVDLTAVNPVGDVVNPLMPTSANGGHYVMDAQHSNIANQNNNLEGQEGDYFGTNATTGNFITGPYFVNATLLGTTTQSLGENPNLSVTVHLFPDQQPPVVNAQPVVFTLTPNNPSATFLVPTPVKANQPTQQLTSANAAQLIQQALGSESFGETGAAVRRRH